MVSFEGIQILLYEYFNFGVHRMNYLQYVIVCPLIFIAGFIDSIAGGGGLISLPAYLIAGLPPHNAIATNKLSSSMGTTVSVVHYAREGYIPWKLAVVCAVSAIIGSSAGARLSLMIDDSVLKYVMLFLIPITAVVVLKSKGMAGESEESLSEGKTLAVAIAVALIIGCYDGFYGPGAGTFMLLALTVIAKMRLQKANGVTKVINLSSNVGSLAVYIINAKVLFPLGLAAGLFGIAGNWLGSRMFTKKGAGAAKPVMLIVLAVFFFKTLFELLGWIS